ncbi:MAG: hypothetical protein H0W74_09005 [Sphingosinicella sp.]|nr:hypothetical protein [Sphingosinicella sp.]
MLKAVLIGCVVPKFFEDLDMKKIALIASLGGIAVSAIALAQAPSGQYGLHGANVTREQALAHADKMFVQLDLDGDGRLFRSEAEKGHQKMRAAMSDEHGKANGHADHSAGHQMPVHMFGGRASVTKVEFRKLALEHFGTMDRNEDGIVSDAEHRQARAASKH